MNATTTDHDADKLRQEILNAAHARFLRYGFSKTTMAEIAKDVSMSAANLYRYFKNKQEITSACACRCMASRLEHLKTAVRQNHLSASQRLLAFAVEGYRHNRDIMQNTPKINELVENITSNNPDLVHANMKAQIALIAEILAYGNETAEFSVEDIISTAETLYITLLLFDVPIFLPLFTEKEFEAKAQRVVTLLIAGIRKH